MSSPRAGSSEENILDMLERDAGSRRSPLVRFTWYGVAGILILGLVGALVWLVRDNSTNRDLDVMLATPATPAAAPAEPTAAMPVLVNAEVHAHAQGAAIIDHPEAGSAALAARAQPAAPQEEAERILPAVPAPNDQEPPPLVLLSAKEAAEARGETVAVETRPEPVNRVREAPPEPDTETALPDKPVATTATRRTTPALARVAAKASGQDAPRPSQARTSARSAAAKPRKSAAAPATDEPVDRDVALISAIIMHSNRHAAEREAQDVKKSEP